MAAINDLIAQIQDVELRNKIEQEVNRMNKQKKFGLVFEEHLPECTPLYEMPVILSTAVLLIPKILRSSSAVMLGLSLISVRIVLLLAFNGFLSPTLFEAFLIFFNGIVTTIEFSRNANCGKERGAAI